MKKALLIALAAVLMLCCTGCMLLTSGSAVPKEALSEEAKAQFSELSGEHGIRLYLDASKNSALKMKLYAVLYGASGQTLTVRHSMTNLFLEISGEPQEGYSVWRVEYSPMGVKKVEFQVNGESVPMDAYEELSFAVEEANRPKG